MKLRPRRDDEKRKTRPVCRKANSARKKLKPRRSRIRKQNPKPSSKNIEVISSLKLMNHEEELPANAHCSFLQPVSVSCLRICIFDAQGASIRVSALEAEPLRCSRRRGAPRPPKTSTRRKNVSFINPCHCTYTAYCRGRTNQQVHLYIEIEREKPVRDVRAVSFKLSIMDGKNHKNNVTFSLNYVLPMQQFDACKNTVLDKSRSCTSSLTKATYFEAASEAELLKCVILPPVNDAEIVDDPEELLAFLLA